jgi:DNA-binding NarL/FixJ family response regulator
MPLKILVVDDFAPFRQFVCSALEDDPGLEVVGQATDGLSAIHKATELQPDLVLLDLRLPQINGLEAAAQIRKMIPNTKILFISGQFSPDIIEVAFRTGALGFIHKMHAGSELLNGIKAVSLGRYFVGGVLGEGSNQAAICHEIQFAPDDDLLQQSLAEYVAPNLKAGAPAIIIATERTRQGVFDNLKTRGIRVDHAIRAGFCVPVDSADLESTVMCGEVPEAGRFFDVADDLIQRVALKAPVSGHSRIVLCREVQPDFCTNSGCRAFRLEQLWDLLAQRSGFSLLCAYCTTSPGFDPEVLEDLRAKHASNFSRSLG